MNKELNQSAEQFRSCDICQFESGGTVVLFVPETLQLFTLSAAAGRILAAIRGGHTVEESASESGTTAEQVSAFLSQVVTTIRQAAPAVAPRQTEDPRTVVGPTLPKLVLMLNNYCNLKCTYCYEHDTIFRETPGGMMRETIDIALDRFYGAFARLQELDFIGGEPTLAPDEIEYACERTLSICRERGIEPPQFCMISNGVRMDDDIFALLRRYRIQVTFSIDGPRDVHDLVRIKHDGTGSYDHVAANIKQYSQEFPDLLGIECTLSSSQAQKGVTVQDLTRFFADEFGASDPHIVAAGLVPGDPLNPFSNAPTRLQREFERASENAINELLSDLSAPGTRQGTRPGLDLVTTMFRKLVRQRSVLEMCPAGTMQLVVDAKGDVYPCWMFAAMPQFRMGNVHTDDVFNPLAEKVLSRIIANHKKQNPQCRVCYARYVCHVCLGNNQNGTGSIEKIEESYCNTIRGALKTVLIKIGQAKQDPEKWAAIKRSVAQAKELHSSELPC